MNFSFQKACKTEEEQLKRLATVINLLPPGNLKVFTKLTEMFVKIAAKKDLNKMGPHNIAIVFSPTLLRYNCTDLAKLISHSEAANNVLVLAIENFRDLFEVS